MSREHSYNLRKNSATMRHGLELIIVSVFLGEIIVTQTVSDPLIY